MDFLLWQPLEIRFPILDPLLLDQPFLLLDQILIPRPNRPFRRIDDRTDLLSRLPTPPQMTHKVQQRAHDGERRSTVDEAESFPTDEDVNRSGLETGNFGQPKVGDESGEHLGDDEGFGFGGGVVKGGLGDAWSDGRDLRGMIVESS